MSGSANSKQSPYNAVSVPQLSDEEMEIFNSIALIADDEDETPKVSPKKIKARAPGKVEWKKAELKPRKPGKIAISLRVDAEVLEWFRAQGKGYQSHIGAVLKAYKKARSRSRAR